ncbi:hypothetical protein JL722_9402 [Aureococcus anophagefferens]|nr:hypothetical protein JL722_9402 [Aureococcus anophagefferens]
MPISMGHKSLNVVKIKAVETTRPKPFKRVEVGEKADLVAELARTVGFDNWNALDMAINLRKFEEHQRLAEDCAAADEEAAAGARARAKEEERRRHLERAQDCVQFMNSWMDAGYQNWKSNQLVKRNRVRFDLRYELALMKRDEVRRTGERLRHEEDGGEGVAWFDRNMKRLGISSASAADGADGLLKSGMSESAMIYLQRIEAQVSSVTRNPEEAAELMLTLRKKAHQNRSARAERERRRRKMGLRGVLRARADRDEAALEATAAAIREARDESAKRKALRAQETCAEAVAKLVDMACVVLKVRETEGRQPMDVPTWRKIKERYLSSEPFFERRRRALAPVDAAATAERAALEAEAYATASGAWDVTDAGDGSPSSSSSSSQSLGADPAVAATATMEALLAEEPPSTRPPRDAGLDVCGPMRVVVIGPGAVAAAAAAAPLHGLPVASPALAIARALELADKVEEEDEEKKGDKEKRSSLIVVRSAAATLEEKGLEIRKLREDQGDDAALPDALLAETLAAYCGALDDEGPKPRPRPTAAPAEAAGDDDEAAAAPADDDGGAPPPAAKLLESFLSGYGDADVDAALAGGGKKGKKADAKKDKKGKGDEAEEEPFASVLEALVVVTDRPPPAAAAPPPAAEAGDDEGRRRRRRRRRRTGARGALEGADAVADWWKTIAATTLFWAPATEAGLEERLDVAVELLYERNAVPPPAPPAPEPEPGEGGDEPPADDAAASLVKAFDDQTRLVKQECAQCYDDFLRRLRVKDARWDRVVRHCVLKMTAKHREVSGEMRLQYLDDMELQLGDVVDARTKTAHDIVADMCEASRLTVASATEQFAVLAAALASAEASRFSTGALTLDDYQQAVDARPVVPSTGDLSKKLSHALGALEAALASCSSPDVAHKVQDAAALVAGLAARPASATRRGKRKSPDVLLQASHLVRRLHAILARFRRVEDELKHIIAGLGQNLREMAAARMRVEHRAVANHGKHFRADLRAGQIVVRDIEVEDDAITIPEVFASLSKKKADRQELRGQPPPPSHRRGTSPPGGTIVCKKCHRWAGQSHRGCCVAMPTGAELKARASVAATGMKRNLFNREKPDKPVKPRQSSPSRLASGMSDLAARVGSLFRGGGGLDDEEANPMDKMAAMRLVDAGLWEAREVDALYKAFNRIRAKDGHRRKATNRYRLPTIADFYRYFRLETSVFCTQVLLLPKAVPLGGMPVEEIEKLELSFCEFALSTWVLCSFELGTLAFSMMDGDQKGYLTRGEVREAVARIYSVHNAGGRGLFDGTKPVDKKLDKVMEGLDCNASGFVSRDEFLSFSHRHHHLLLPAFGVQRSVRERVFGPTVRWAANERRRQRLVQQRTVQQVVADIAKLVPELGGGAAPRPGAGDSYMHEPDGDKVMDHAAMAYRNGDMDQARRIYDYHARGDQESVFQGDVVRKNVAVAGLAMDGTDAAAAANLRRKPNPKDKAANGKQSDKPFGGRRYNDDYAKEQKAKRNAGKRARAVGQDPGST